MDKETLFALLDWLYFNTTLLMCDIEEALAEPENPGHPLPDEARALLKDWLEG